MNSDNTPQLRFPGFTGEWEEKSLGEIYKKNNVKNDLSFGVDKIISVANMYFKNDAVVGDEDYLRSYNIFRIGDIAYEGNKSANYAYGRFVENTIGDGIVSHVFDVYSPISPDHCIEYWKYAINYEGIMRPILEKSTIKSTMMTNLIAKDFLKQKILVPPSTAEQEKIASCLFELDTLISVQGEKVNAMKEKKKGLMQQLFPKLGETTPQLRFPGFEGEWVGERLDVVSIINPRTETLPDTFIYIDLESVVSGSLIKRNIIKRENAPSRAQRNLKDGDILFQMVRPYQRNNYHFHKNEEIEYVASTGYAQIRYDICSEYLYQYLHTDAFVDTVTKKCVGGNYPAINSSDLGSIKVFMPKPSEQQKIAECLSALDELIFSESAKLDSLKDHKKGLMQQLFPQPSK